jgi:hypothetical protein
VPDRGIVTPAAAAAESAEDAARMQAVGVVAVETALRTATGDEADLLRTELRERLAGLARAAAAVEELATDAEELVGAEGRDAASRLRAAVDDVLARSHGLRVASSIGRRR